MLQTLSDFYYRLPLNIQNLFSRQWYERVSLIDREADMIFMNYGWADLDPEAEQMPLHPQDEPNRYCIQLYQRVAGAVDLHGKDVLEVGSGRGGGASYIMRCLEPLSMTGFDLADNAVAFCRQHYAGIPGMGFVQGKAEDMQFVPGTFDAVVNVESSHCYEDMSAFLAGVRRVLRPGGCFLYTDHRRKDEIDLWLEQISASGLTILEQEDISANIVRALELDNDRKQALINHKVPRVMRHFFREFAGIEGTRSQYAALRSGEKIYLRFVLQK